MHAETPPVRRREIVAEGIAVVEELEGRVAEKLEHVQRFHASLKLKAEGYRKYLAEIPEP